MEILEPAQTTGEVVKYKENPFLAKDVIKVSTRKKRLTVAKGGTLIDNETGDVEGITEIAQVVEVDDGQFVKMFTKDIELFFDLSAAAIKTFGLILKITQTEAINRDKVFIDYKESGQLAAFKLSTAVFYRGINELVEKQFIAKNITPNWYFINPSLFFNGDRARFIKEYRRKADGKMTKTENHYYRLEFKKYRAETGKKQADFTDAGWAIVDERAKTAELAGKKPRLRLAA